MDNLGTSSHIRFASQTLEWFGMDSEEAYQRNIKSKHDLMRQYGWVDKKFTYQFNQHGFRSEEFTGGDSIVFLGASNTLCTGVPLEESWPYKVASSLNLRRYNLGLGGTSGSTAFRMAKYWLDKLNPKIVVLMSPMNARFELADDVNGKQTYFQLSPDMPREYFRNSQLKSDYVHFYKIWIGAEDNILLLQEKNELAIECLANKINAKFILADSIKDCQKIVVDLGRDLSHAGTKTNQLITNLILDRIG